MLANLFLGTVAISMTVFIHIFGLIGITRAVAFLTARWRLHGRRSRLLAIIIVVMGLFAVLTAEVWLWAAFYFALGELPDFGASLYFSTVTFSTLGYGDIVPTADWRMFAALESIDGLLLIGWSTAYLVAAGMRVGPFRAGEHF
jgi:hypothetical protein